MKQFREWVKQAEGMGLTERFILASHPAEVRRYGRYMAKNVSGSSSRRDHRSDREGARPAEEGSNSVWNRSRNPGDEGSGFISAIEWEHRLPEIVERAKLCPGPRFRIEEE
jgi:methylenetetrahydrofolate reductase (NADPH)